MTAVVKPVGKEHGVYIGEWLLGTTKLQCDAQMHANKINEAQSINETTSAIYDLETTLNRDWEGGHGR